jgi:hypothetical protein
MPVILRPGEYDRLMDAETSAAARVAMMRLFPAEMMMCEVASAEGRGDAGAGRPEERLFLAVAVDVPPVAWVVMASRIRAAG